MSVFEGDMYLERFLLPGYDISQFLKEKFKELSEQPDVTDDKLFAEDLKRLDKGIEIVQTQIHDFVKENDQKLVEKVKKIPIYQQVVMDSQGSIEILSESLLSLENSLIDPTIETKLGLLEQNCERMEMIQQVSLFLKHLRLMGDWNKNIAKTSLSIAQLENMINSQNLKGIKVVDDATESIRNAGQEIRIVAKNQLWDGIKSGKQNEILDALQVLINLNSMDTVTTLFTKIQSDCQVWVQTMFTKNNKLSGSLQRQGEKNEVLNSLKDTLGGLILQSTYISNFKIMKKKGYDANIDTHFVWMLKIFSEKLVTHGNQTKSIFVEDYPQVSLIFNEFVDKLSQFYPLISDWKTNLLDSYEKAYLTNILSKITERITTCFKNLANPVSHIGEEQPMNLDLRIPLHSIVNELVASRNEDRLCKLVAQTCSKGIVFLATQFEKQAILHPDAVKVYDIPTRFQRFNAVLYNSFYKFYQQLTTSLDGFPLSIKNVIYSALGNLEQLMTNQIITPFFKGIISNLDRILFKLHRIDYETKVDSTSPGGFIIELENSIEVIRKAHLALFESSSTPFINGCKMIASNTCKFYMKQICLIREMSDNGRMQILKEMSQFDVLISSNIFPLDNIKDVSSQFKSLRNLLFVDLEKGHVETSLDPILVLHHLLTRVPKKTLEGPDQLLNMTIEKYSDWMSESLEKEIMQLLDVVYEKVPNEPIYTVYKDFKK